MNRYLQLAIAGATVLASIIGTTLAIDSRYAKSQEVRTQLETFYQRSIRLKILEIDLKPNPTPSDRALRQYLQSELNKSLQGQN